MAASVHEQIQAELQKKREADDKIKKLKAREANRLGRIADRVGLHEIAVSDDDLAAGLRHAMELSRRRANGVDAPTEEQATA